jgi:hypothetical protein
MKTRWLALLLLVVLAGLLPAQTPGFPDRERPSHKPVNTRLADDRSPEDLLDKRLAGFRLKEKQDEFGNIQELARKLLDNREFLESLRKSLKPEDIERLKKQYGQGTGGPLDDPALKGMLEKALKDQKLDDRDREVFQRWKEKLGNQGSPGVSRSKNDPEKGKLPPATAGTPSTPSPPPPGSTQPWQPGSSSGLDRDTPEWLKKGLARGAEDLGKWIDSPSGRSWRDSISDMVKRAAEARASAPPVAGRLRGFTRYMPDVRRWLPRRSPDLPTARLPGVPRVTGRLPGAPSLSNVTADGVAKVLVVGLAVAVAALLLWRSRGWWQDVLAARLAAWKLGPWPVRPADVTTRGDLVRAFEYLAVLCLGPGARTCHHLELARRLGAQPAVDPERRRDAAVDLAHVYEQARYTPDDEVLPDDLLRRARRELCYLAGEPAA